MIPFLSESRISGEATVYIDNSIDKVFRFVASDFITNYPRWSPEVEGIVLLTEGPLHVGSRLRQHRLEQSDQKESLMIVTDFHMNSLFGYAGETECYRGVFSFKQTSECESTELQFEFFLEDVEIVMRPFTKLIRTAIQEGVGNAAENIKELLEKHSTID